MSSIMRWRRGLIVAIWGSGPERDGRVHPHPLRREPSAQLSSLTPTPAQRVRSIRSQMCEQQLDLFSSAGIQAERPLPQSMELRPAATVLDDQALIAAIPESNLADSIALATEAGRRRLAAAVPSLEALCRRFSGFGAERMVPEQAVALHALAMISGREAAQAVSQLIVRGFVRGPALNLAVSTAARIGATLPVDVLRSLLRHPDPGVRASACGCARRRPELIA